MDRNDAQDALRALGRFVVGEAPLPELMQRIATTARELIGPADEASITFTRGDDQGWTVATTSNLATALDEAQYTLGHGPCLDAGTGGETLLVRNFATDGRWPDFARTVLDHGVHASLSVPFPIQQHVIAALNMYSGRVDPFDETHVDLAQEIASQAAVAVANAVLYESAAKTAENLQQAMASRATIEQAKGIIIATSHCSPDEAFDILVRASQRENRKLREIASELVERHQHPAD